MNLILFFSLYFPLTILHDSDRRFLFYQYISLLYSCLQSPHKNAQSISTNLWLNHHVRMDARSRYSRLITFNSQYRARYADTLNAFDNSTRYPRMFKRTSSRPSRPVSLLRGFRMYAIASSSSLTSSSSFSSSSSSYEPRSFSDSPAYRGLHKISNVFCNGSRKKLPPEFLLLRPEKSSTDDVLAEF